ncbi:DUF7933 domain-containing protein [Nocardioides sambongensis]|uniref:DUF7933 domain-containing protein n=1 Tax=Nocardioides sambongensis TaxID=2589074 RepID=UPI0015E86CE4|nr:hypothetical protein [Nocardioides sambongensis]
MDNLRGSGTGNDTAFDNIVVLDTTPKIDKEFQPGPLPGGDYPVGGTGQLTFTVTNTHVPGDPDTPSGPKQDWSFTDTLNDPALEVATPLDYTTTCADGEMSLEADGSLSASGDLAGATVESCTFTVDVTADTPGTYTNGPGDMTVSGLDPAGETAITFVGAPEPPECPTPHTLWDRPGNTAGSTQLSEIDLTTSGLTPIADLAQGIDAVGYNEVDGNFYGLQVPASGAPRSSRSIRRRRRSRRSACPTLPTPASTWATGG